MASTCCEWLKTVRCERQRVKIIVTGSAGMLGRDLMERLAGAHFTAVGLTSAELDITRATEVSACMVDTHPDLVINCAAYTDVDGCESNRETAMAVNAEGVANLARVSRGIGARLVQVSTDYVFDGAKGSPYLEDDQTNPLSVYGQSKLLGEKNAATNPDHLIVRTQWLYGLQGTNFVETMLRLGTEKECLTVVDDQIGSPTWTVDLSRAILALLARGCRGTYHAANAGFCSWNEFARAIFQKAGLGVRVDAMTTEQLNRPARRPLYSTLDCSKLERDTGFRLQSWGDALTDYMKLRTHSNRG
jgi:dTDP-4-dehydrorhamnose reductase